MKTSLKDKIVRDWAKEWLRYNRNVSDSELNDFIERSKHPSGCGYEIMEINIKMPFVLHELKKRNRRNENIIP